MPPKTAVALDILQIAWPGGVCEIQIGGWLPLCGTCLSGLLTTYIAVWKITVTGDNMVLKEQSGSHCCFFVPNPFLKTHRMVREDENTWAGTLACRRIYVKRVAENELRHWTTDGWLTLTR